MLSEAIKADFYETAYGAYRKIQICTIADLFRGVKPDIPLIDPSAFRRAPREAKVDQGKLGL